MGPFGRLYNCIRYILKTPQRREPLGLIIVDDTRWSGDLAAIVRVLLLREPHEDYPSSAIRLDRRRDEASSLVHDELSPEHWEVRSTVVELLEPFKKWTDEGSRGSSLGYPSGI